MNPPVRFVGAKISDCFLFAKFSALKTHINLQKKFKPPVIGGLNEAGKRMLFVETLLFESFQTAAQGIEYHVGRLLETFGTRFRYQIVSRNMERNGNDFVALLLIFVEFHDYIGTRGAFSHTVEFREFVFDEFD